MPETRKLINPIRRLKPGEDIKYLLLIKVINSDETYWDVITGRENAYNFIKDNIGEIDVENSFVIANKMKEVDLDNMHTVYGFVQFVKNQNDIVDEFDIDDYISNIDNSADIGVGLESAGNIFTGISGSFESADNDDE